MNADYGLHCSAGPPDHRDKVPGRPYTEWEPHSAWPEEQYGPHPRSLGFTLSLMDIQDVLLLLDLHADPRLSLMSQLSSLEDDGYASAGRRLPTLLPGGITVRSRHRLGAVVGHTYKGGQAIAMIGQQGDGVRQHIRQANVGSARSLAEVRLGPPEEALVFFDIEQWPVLEWNDVATLTWSG